MKNRIVSVIFGVCVATVATRVEAATRTVTSLADSGTGSLRAALAAATNGDTIDASGITGTITLTSGELLVESNVTIRGPGPAFLAVNGNAAGRVFDVHYATVTIAGLTVTNGNFAGGAGGGIYNYQSSLTVSNCVITGSTARNGGGLCNDYGASGASVTLRASVLSGNSANYGGGLYINGGGASVIASTMTSNSANYGGGVYNSGRTVSSAVTVQNSSLSGNTAAYDPTFGGGQGGGLYNDGESGGSATASVLTSTFNGNSGDGGGIFNDGYSGHANLYVYTSTFSGNAGSGIENSAYSGVAIAAVNASTFSGNSQAGYGDSIANYYGTVQIGDSILSAPSTNILNFNGSFTSHGYNVSSDDGAGWLVGTGDQVNTDPMLGPLGNNGGPTLTHALLAGSPAIDQGKRDAISYLALTMDQRGWPRPADVPSIANASGGDGSDIGAFEFVPQPQLISISALTNRTIQLQGAGLSNFTYTIEASTNLGKDNWTAIGSAVASASGIFSITDNAAAILPARFYRASFP